ncbi:MAG: NigD-like protein [Prevotella sp.]|nr:NigD-like protein [Prevotella sp.]
MKLKKFILPLLLAIVVSCQNDAYDTGDGSLSNMRVDFVEAKTNSLSTITSVVTDDDESLSLYEPISTSWATVPDTIYRALLYYNKISSNTNTYLAQAIAISQVPVFSIAEKKAPNQEILMDPVNFISIWKSKSGKYINLDLYLKVGNLDDDASLQTLGMFFDGVSISSEGEKKVTLLLYHDQNGMPEYYSSEVYASIPVDGIPQELSQGDIVEVIINTYDGLISKTIEL